MRSDNPENKKITDVAVGVLVRDDGSYLLGSRPEGKPYAGYWEFPGGKLEENESVEQALYRELNEELGIQISGSQPWEVIEYDYPHAYVRLHIHRVNQWQGEPMGREGQDLVWQPNPLQGNPTVEPLLPATIVLLDLMRAQKRDC